MFAAHLDRLDSHEIGELRLGKKREELLEEAGRLHRQRDRDAYGPPPVRFTDQDVDQARAAGVLVEFDRSAPVIADRGLYRQLANAAIERTVSELRQKAAAAAEEKKEAANRDSGKPVDPLAHARIERDRQLRELADQAHGVNLDLGRGLLNRLALVDPSDIDVARFFVLCGYPHRSDKSGAETMPIRQAPRRHVAHGAGHFRTGRPGCSQRRRRRQRALPCSTVSCERGER